MKKGFITCLALFLFFLFAPRVFQAKADHFIPLPTEFRYCGKDLSQIRSPYLITIERVDKWEQPLQHYFAEKHIGYSTQLRFYTYLYTAQRDAAFLSYNVHRCFVGSLDPLVKKVIDAFFPDFDTLPDDFYTDPYSEELASQIWPSYAERLERENASPHQFKPCDNQPIPNSIAGIAKWIPWVQPLPEVPPPSKETENVEQKPLTEEQRHLIHVWAGEKKLIRHWRMLINDYMQKEGVPLGKILFVRSILSMGLYDSQIAVINAKYMYCVPRPENPVIKKPDTPAYPSGHAAQSGTAEVILTYFFPDAASHWHRYAEEASQSRVWARVHSEGEVKAGLELGKKVGESTLNTVRGAFSGSCEPPPRRCPFSER
jgi:hypothetical protein